MWVKPHQEQTALFVPDCKGELNLLDAHLPVIARQLEVGDQLCFVGVRECLEDIAGLEISFFHGSQLEGMTFFELKLVRKLFLSLFICITLFEKAQSFPVTPLSVREFNTLFQCRVRRINRHGEYLHLGSGSVRDGRACIEAGDICIVEARFDILHLQNDARFKGVAELQFTVGKIQVSRKEK